LATINTLNGKPAEGVTDAKMLIDRITNPKTPAHIAAYALRLAPILHEGLGIDTLKSLLNRKDPDLTREVVRTLAMRKDDGSQNVLVRIAQDDTLVESLRLDALAGLIGANDPDIKSFVVRLSESQNGSIAKEAQRVSRQSGWVETLQMTHSQHTMVFFG
jgi:hypothetical protein